MVQQTEGRLTCSDKVIEVFELLSMRTKKLAVYTNSLSAPFETSRNPGTKTLRCY